MADGSIGYSTEAEAEMASDQAFRGGTALVAELLALMATLIGEALTFRLVHEVWPKAAMGESKPREKQS